MNSCFFSRNLCFSIFSNQKFEKTEIFGLSSKAFTHDDEPHDGHDGGDGFNGHDGQGYGQGPGPGPVGSKVDFLGAGCVVHMHQVLSW